MLELLEEDFSVGGYSITTLRFVLPHPGGAYVERACREGTIV